jgi:hypothetical protein
MKKFKNIVVVTGTYRTREGQEKKRYQTIGSVILDDNDNLKIKIDSIPIVDGGWTGWANCYELEEREAPKAPKVGFEDMDQNIPF